MKYTVYQRLYETMETIQLIKMESFNTEKEVKEFILSMYKNGVSHLEIQEED